MLATAAPAHAQTTTPAQKAQREDLPVPGFWDPRRRPERPDLSRLQQIRFLTEVDYPPFNYAGGDGLPAGFNVDLARLICDELKIVCTIQMRRFDTLVPSLIENRGEAIIASIAVTEETRKLVDFSDPYYRLPARFVARKTVATAELRPEQVEGRKVAVVTGSSHEAYLKTLFTEAQPVAYRTADIAREALRKGEVDYVFGDGVALSFWLNGTDSGQLLRIRRRPVFREPLFRRRRRHRGQARQRHVAACLQLGAVPAVGEGPLHGFVAAVFSDQPVLNRSFRNLTRRHAVALTRERERKTMSVAEKTANLRELAEQSGAWPFEEARKIVARLKKKPKDTVMFATGYGPSGLPHIGTFGEVARTTMVRHAFRVLTDDKIKTRLIAFSDDMDGLRKVPDNVPNKDMLAEHLGKPLTKVPDPFGTHDSFGAHNNARLRAFLDTFGFEYEFLSSTDCYTSGRFDETLLRMLSHFDKVMAIMLPSLREERAQTYSPFLPISPRTGIVLQVPVTAHDAKAGTITYEDPDSKEQVTTPVTGGRCKLQWKPDWAMRWVALGIDYEMAGKDLIDSVKLSSEICRAIGGLPPEGFNYELFLDEKGQKISKSKGNGLTIDEWLRYASPKSLSLFMYREPKAAKRLFFDVIPRHMDEYQQFLRGYQTQGPKERLANPVWHIHSGNPPQSDMPVTFQLLLTLVSSSNAENAETLWGFIRRYRPGVTPKTHPELDAHGRLRHPLFPRFRAADQEIPRADRSGARGFDRSARCAVAAEGRRFGREHPGRGLRDRPARTVPRQDRQDQDQGRQAGRRARLVQHALSGAARAGEGTALRLVRRGLRPQEHHRHDRRRAGAVGRNLLAHPDNPRDPQHV